MRPLLKEAYIRGYKTALKRLNESVDTDDAIEFMEWVVEDLETLLKKKFRNNGVKFASRVLASDHVFLLNELQFMKNANNYSDWYEDYYDEGEPNNLILKATKDFIAKNRTMQSPKIDRDAFCKEVVEQYDFLLSYLSMNFGLAY